MIGSCSTLLLPVVDGSKNQILSIVQRKNYLEKNFGKYFFYNFAQKVVKDGGGGGGGGGGPGPWGNNLAGSEGSLHMSTAPCKEVFWRSWLPTRRVNWRCHWYCWWEVVCEDGTLVCSLVPGGTIAGRWKNRWCAVVCPEWVLKWGWK